KKSFYLVYSQNQVTVSADIIEIASDTSDVYSEKYFNTLHKVLTLNSFQLNEEVLVHKMEKVLEGEIKGFGNKTAIVVYKTKNGNIVEKELPIAILYKTSGLETISPHTTIKLNDTIEYIIMENGSTLLIRAVWLKEEMKLDI